MSSWSGSALKKRGFLFVVAGNSNCRQSTDVEPNFVGAWGQVEGTVVCPRPNVLLPVAVDIDVSGVPSVLSGKFALLIWDGFSLTVRRATQEGRASFKVAQQSCRRKDAQSSGGNFPDSALGLPSASKTESTNRPATPRTCSFVTRPIATSTLRLVGMSSG